MLGAWLFVKPDVFSNLLPEKMKWGDEMKNQEGNSMYELVVYVTDKMDWIRRKHGDKITYANSSYLITRGVIHRERLPSFAPLNWNAQELCQSAAGVYWIPLLSKEKMNLWQKTLAGIPRNDSVCKQRTQPRGQRNEIQTRNGVLWGLLHFWKQPPTQLVKAASKAAWWEKQWHFQSVHL